MNDLNFEELEEKDYDNKIRSLGNFDHNSISSNYKVDFDDLQRPKTSREQSL